MSLQQSKLQIKIVGILDDNARKIGRRLHDVPIIGTIDTLNDLKINFDEIYICVPSANRNQMQRIVDECKKTSKPFKTLLNFHTWFNCLRSNKSSS